MLCASERYLEGRDATEPAMLHWIALTIFFPTTRAWSGVVDIIPGCCRPTAATACWRSPRWPAPASGLAAIPAYLLRDGDGLRVLDADLEGCASALWLLTRPDCRALRSVVALFDELGRHVRLGDE